MVNWWKNHFVTSKIVCTVITALPASGLVLVLIMKIECGKRVFSEWSQWLVIGRWCDLFPHYFAEHSPKTLRGATCSGRHPLRRVDAFPARLI